METCEEQGYEKHNNHGIIHGKASKSSIAIFPTSENILCWSVDNSLYLFQILGSGMYRPDVTEGSSVDLKIMCK